jgi:hypothetical protein
MSANAPVLGTATASGPGNSDLDSAASDTASRGPLRFASTTMHSANMIKQSRLIRVFMVTVAG